MADKNDDQLREEAFSFKQFEAPSHLPRKDREDIALKRAAHFHAGFEADTSADCLLSWVYGQPTNEKAIVVAGLPVRQKFDPLPAVGDVLTFTPILVALYGAGKEVPQEPRTAKVVSIVPAYSNRFDYTMTLEVLYE